MSILVIDAGNTSVKYAHFKDGKLVSSWRHATAVTAQDCAAILAKTDVPVFLSSVVPTASAAILAECKNKNRKVTEIAAASQTILSGMDATMGADRVAESIAAFKLYGKGKPVIQLGFGTGTTLLAVSAAGHVLGGWIAPGMLPTLEVLHDRCALLPLLKMEGQSDVLGYDTDTHMRNGVFLAHVGLARQWIDSARKAAGANSVVVATGGWASTIQAHTALFDVVDSELTLKGIALIAEALTTTKVA